MESTACVAQCLQHGFECLCESYPLFRRQQALAVTYGPAAHEAAARIDRSLQIGLIENTDAALAYIGGLEFPQAIEAGIRNRCADFQVGTVRPEQLRQRGAHLLRVGTQSLVSDHCNWKGMSLA